MTDRECVARAILAHKVPLPHGDIEWALLFLSELVKDRTGRWTPEVRADAVELLNLLAASAADAALAAMPTWRRIPGDVREGEAPFDGNAVWAWREDAGVFQAIFTEPLDSNGDAEGDPIWFTTMGEDISDDPPTYWQRLPVPAAPIPPLPAPPAGEVGVVAIGYANTATGGVEIDNAGIIRRAPGAVDMPAGRGKE